MTSQYSTRKFGGKGFSYFSGSFSEEMAEEMKKKIRNTGGEVRTTRGRKRHPTNGRKEEFYSVWMR